VTSLLLALATITYTGNQPVTWWVAVTQGAPTVVTQGTPSMTDNGYHKSVFDEDLTPGVWRVESYHTSGDPASYTKAVRYVQVQEDGSDRDHQGRGRASGVSGDLHVVPTELPFVVIPLSEEDGPCAVQGLREEMDPE